MHYARWKQIQKSLIVPAAAAAVLLLAACAAPAAAPATEAAAGSGGDKVKVGALHVGAINDAGYNQAQHEGLMKLKEAMPNVEVLEVENVPESADAERVMENLG